MKILLIFLLLLGQCVMAQVAIQPLNSAKFYVSLYVGKEHDSNQTLSFNEGKMTFSEAEKYGFVADEYKWKQKNDSTLTFLCVVKSPKNGVMTWEGKVIHDKMEGTCIWTRKVENPVNYTFKGSRLKE